MVPVGGVSISDLLAGYVALPSAAVTAGAAWTLEGQVRLRALPANLQTLVAEGSSVNSTSVVLGVNASGFPVLLTVESGGGAGNVTGAVNLADGSEHHLVATLSGTVLSLFADGVLVGTVAKPGAFVPNTTTIGARRMAAVDRVLNGRAARVRLWSRALTAAEIAERSLGREVARAGLVADLPLDEGIGPRALDRSDVPLYDGTLTGAIVWAQPKAVRGIRADDGATHWVDVPQVDLAAQHSIVCWLRYRGTGFSGFGTIVGTRRARLTVAPNDRVSMTYRAAAGSVVDSADLPLGVAESHVAVTHDGTTARCYRNGELRASSTFAVPAPNPAKGPGVSLLSEQYSGIGAGDQQARASVRDVAIFDRALTQAEIRSIVAGADPRSISGCIAYFPLEGDTLNYAPPLSVQRNLIARGGAAVDFTWDAVATGWALFAGGTMGADLARQALVRETGANGSTAVTRVGFPADPAKRAVAVTLELSANREGKLVDVMVFDPTVTFIRAQVTNFALSPSEYRQATVLVPAELTDLSFNIDIRNAGNGADGVAGDVLFVRRATAVVGSAFTRQVTSAEMARLPAAHGLEVGAPRLARPSSWRGLRPSHIAVGVVSVPIGAWIGTGGVANEFTITGRMLFVAGKARGALIKAGGANGVGLGIGSSGSDLGDQFPNDKNVEGATLNGLFEAIAWITGAVLSVGTRWVDVAFSVAADRRTWVIYADGIAVARGVAGTPYTTPTGSVNIGGVSTSDASRNAKYPVEAVRIYNRVLSAAEIEALRGDVSVPRSGLVGEWLVDTPSGSIVPDTSGRANHGILSGSAAAA